MKLQEQIVRDKKKSKTYFKGKFQYLNYYYSSALLVLKQSASQCTNIFPILSWQANRKEVFQMMRKVEFLWSFFGTASWWPLR